MKRLFLLMLLLVGCSPREIVRYEPVEVRVPVAVPWPEPPVLERPVLPIETLPASASPADVLRAYVASALLLMAYVEELEALLDAYRVAPSDTLTYRIRDGP